jgi:hypothetical protein
MPKHPERSAQFQRFGPSSSRLLFAAAALSIYHLIEMNH